MTPSAIIALVSLVISIATFVIINFRPPKISAFLGPRFQLSNPNPEQVTLVMPITFSNLGAKVGSIIRTAVVVYHVDTPYQLYFMQWDSFANLQTQTTLQWVHEELAHVLVVQGKSMVSKNVSFAWFQNSSTSPLKFREGIYKIVFLYWTSEFANPHRETTQVLISASILANLQRDPPASTAILQLDEKLKVNIPMNENDFSKQFGRIL